MRVIRLSVGDRTPRIYHRGPFTLEILTGRDDISPGRWGVVFVRGSVGADT